MAAELNVQSSASRQMRTNWFAHLRDISDIELQRRTWLDQTNRNPHWSYVEFVYSYPDEDQLHQALKEGWLSTEELKILSDFGHTLRAHSAPGGDDYDNAAVLADPAWHFVVKAAAEATEHLLSMTTDRREREMLRGTK